MRADIAIIGGGFSGTLAVWQLVRQARGPLTVLWFEGRDGQWGRGVAYGTTDPVHLLNVPAGRMSADPDRTDDFLDWLKREEPRWRALDPAFAALALTETAFMPRRVYGLYLQDTLAEAEAEAAKRSIHIGRHSRLVTAATPEAEGWQLQTNDHSFHSRTLVLATGHAASQRWNIEGQAEPLPPYWNHPPRPPEPSEAAVAILGTGLSMVDAVMSLHRQAYNGTVHAFSRNGRLPWPHRLDAPPYDWQGRIAPGMPLTDWKHRLETALTETTPGQPVVDALRPLTNPLWQGWTAEEKRDFWRKEASLWAVRRHRIPPASAAVLDEWRQQGKLIVHASESLSLHRRGAKTELRWREAGRPQSLTVATLFNATGASYVPEDSANPLLDSLVKQGLLTCGASGKGAALESWLCIDRARRLWLLGPLLQDAALESTAVPEIRQQAKDLAAALLNPYH